MTSPRDVCRWAEFDNLNCDASDAKAMTIIEPVIFRNSSSTAVGAAAPRDAERSKGSMTWARLDAEDFALSTEVYLHSFVSAHQSPVFVDQDHVFGVRL